MLHASSVTLKRGRLDQLPPRTMLDINQAQDAVSLRDVAPGQPIQLSMLRQAWRVKAGQQNGGHNIIARRLYRNL